MGTALLMAGETRNADFAAYIEELTAGRSGRELSRATRDAGLYVNPTSITDMRWGIVPGYKTLERFAAGLHLTSEQTAELFRRAGYAPPAITEPSGEEIFFRGVQELMRKYDRPVVLERYDEDVLDAEGARQMLASVERRILEDIEREKRLQSES